MRIFWWSVRVAGIMAWLLTATLGWAQTSINYNFEDGQRRGAATPMQVPPQVLTENGNKFMRITGSRGDCSSVPSCPPRNRSTVRFTSSFGSMPLISSSNMRQTYSADLRFHDAGGSDGSVFELFQGGGRTGGYGTRDGQGPVVRFWRQDGRISVSALYANETKKTNTSWSVGAGSRHNYKVVAVWSHDPSVGAIDIYFDGQLKMRVRGRDVNLGPGSNRIPELKLGMYGDNATGVIDVDNIRVFGTGDSGGEEPPPPPPRPDPDPEPPPPRPPAPAPPAPPRPSPPPWADRPPVVMPPLPPLPPTLPDPPRSPIPSFPASLTGG